MKKKGFTLAEVLMVIAVIGIVAVFTIPVLYASTQGREHQTASGKALSALNSALQMRFALEEGESMDDYTGSLGAYLTRQIDPDPVTGIGINTNKVAFSGAQVHGSTGTGCPAAPNTDACKISAKDGTIWYFPAGATSLDTGNGCSSPNGCLIWVDTNGPRGPSKNKTDAANRDVMKCGGNVITTGTSGGGITNPTTTNNCPDIVALRVVSRDAEAADQRSRNIILTGYANRSE